MHIYYNIYDLLTSLVKYTCILWEGVKKMSREQIFEEIKGALVEVLGLEDDSNIKEEDNIVDNLGADSLDFVELVMKLENIFEVKIEDEDVEKVVTVEDLVNLIENIL